MTRIFGLIMMAALLAVPAQAQVTRDDFSARTVADLHKLCAAADADRSHAYAIGFCYGWLEGAGQFYEEMFLDPRFELRPLVCNAEELTREQARTIFVDWARANPGEAGRPALSGVITAMKEQYPCR